MTAVEASALTNQRRYLRGVMLSARARREEYLMVLMLTTFAAGVVGYFVLLMAAGTFREGVLVERAMGTLMGALGLSLLTSLAVGGVWLAIPHVRRLPTTLTERYSSSGRAAHIAAVAKRRQAEARAAKAAAAARLEKRSQQQVAAEESFVQAAETLLEAHGMNVFLATVEAREMLSRGVSAATKSSDS